MALGLLVALATAGSTAGAADRPTEFLGSFESGGEVSLRLSGGANKAVDRISIHAIAANCHPGSATLDFNIHGDTPVLDDRSFAVRSEDGTGGKAFVKGRFSRKYKRVKGAVRVHGKFFDKAARCDSEKQRFHGSR